MKKLLENAPLGNRTGSDDAVAGSGTGRSRRVKPNGHQADIRHDLHKKLAAPPQYVPEEAYCTDPGDDAIRLTVSSW